MSRRHAGASRWALLVLGLYALLLAGNPLLHHDLACHVKSPTHCEACVTSAVASRIEAGARVDLDARRPAGEVAHESSCAAAHRPRPAASGRAPPA